MGKKSRSGSGSTRSSTRRTHRSAARVRLRRSPSAAVATSCVAAGARSCVMEQRVSSSRCVTRYAAACRGGAEEDARRQCRHGYLVGGQPLPPQQQQRHEVVSQHRGARESGQPEGEATRLSAEDRTDTILSRTSPRLRQAVASGRAGVGGKRSTSGSGCESSIQREGTG